MGNVLETENLSIGYSHKRRQIVVGSNLNITIGIGKLTALIGANGAGKSTLLRTICGMQPPLNGTVIIDGNDIISYSQKELSKKLSIVLTDKLPPSDLTVFELVALGRQPYTNWIGTMTGEDQLAVRNALVATQMLDLAHRKHYELSDGQLQKALVARAIAQDTPIIVLDEPTTHLDLNHKAALFRLLRQLASDTGKTVLFSTHDIEMALQLSDEIIVLTDSGMVQMPPSELVASGTLNTLFSDDQIQFDNATGKFIFKNT